MILRAFILRLPGRDGHGAYTAEVGGCNCEFAETGAFRASLAEARSDLAAMLARRGAPPERASAVAPRLVYGGAWAEGALERQPGYNPALDPRLRPQQARLLNLLWANAIAAAPHGSGLKVRMPGGEAVVADDDALDALVAMFLSGSSP